MINCKQDLINTYIENDKGELRDLYISACKKFNIELGFNSVKEGKYMQVWDGAIIQTNTSDDHKQLTLEDFQQYGQIDESLKPLSIGDVDFKQEGKWDVIKPKDDFETATDNIYKNLGGSFREAMKSDDDIDVTSDDIKQPWHSKPKTKVDYVECGFKTFSAAYEEMKRNDDVQFYVGTDDKKSYNSGCSGFYTDNNLNALMNNYNNLYRRVETEVTYQDEIEQSIESLKVLKLTLSTPPFIDGWRCHVVAIDFAINALTNKPE